MYSKLVKKYSDEMYDLTRHYNNGVIDDENYYNEINYLLEEFEKKNTEYIIRKIKECINGSTS